MNKSEFFQALTLWFATVIFLLIEPGSPGGVVIAASAIVALCLQYLLPIYLVLGVGGELISAHRTVQGD